MRRLKAIYIVPVALVLLIGAGFAFYYFLLKPQMEATAKSQQAWEAAYADMKKSEADYQQKLDEHVAAAKQLYNDHYVFRQIQNTMPAILNMKEVYAGKEREGLVVWYNTMGKGKLITELNRWCRGFHLPPDKTPKFTYTGTLGYEETLPSINMVSINFGSQEFFALGYANLLGKISRQTGYRYFPLVLDGVEPAKFEIKVDRSNPKHRAKTPALTMKYTIIGYFLTRGWDPAGADAKKQVEEAMQIILNPPKKEREIDVQAMIDEIPHVLWVFKPTVKAP